MCPDGQRLRLSYLTSTAGDQRDGARQIWTHHLRTCPACRAWWDAIAAAGTVVEHKPEIGP